eukprot:SAG22_NODE_536_length_9364_cov_15.973988_10_plen_282_part_00
MAAAGGAAAGPQHGLRVEWPGLGPGGGRRSAERGRPTLTAARSPSGLRGRASRGRDGGRPRRRRPADAADPRRRRRQWCGWQRGGSAFLSAALPSWVMSSPACPCGAAALTTQHHTTLDWSLPCLAGEKPSWLRRSTGSLSLSSRSVAASNRLLPVPVPAEPELLLGCPPVLIGGALTPFLLRCSSRLELDSAATCSRSPVFFSDRRSRHSFCQAGCWTRSGSSLPFRTGSSAPPCRRSMTPRWRLQPRAGRPCPPHEPRPRPRVPAAGPVPPRSAPTTSS